MLDRLADNLDIWGKRPGACRDQNKQEDQNKRTRAPVSCGATGSEAMAEDTIGFVGTGRMGGPMAGRLLDAGYSLSVYDMQSEATKPLVARGARLAKSPAEVASSADIVLTSLPTPDIVKAVALGPDGIIAGNRASIVIDLSTTGPGAAKLIAEGFKPRKTLVDAPVSGGVKGAVNGTLAVMVSCPKATYERVEPILKNFGKLFYTGDKPGTAQTAKLANNLMAAAALVITSEAVAMGVKGGVDAKVLIDIINASSGRNSASEDKFPRAVLPGTFDFGFTTGLSYKDVRLCVDEAEAMGVPMVCGSVVRQMLAITNAKYGPSSDFTSIAKVLEEWAGVEMRG
ncbi:MAG TPA: NAD(P)-dependent oxidoreductase [Bradyrhizobium sp.]|nr:NAD(P)-dependent oxidoreductase [Bradyrhizobium sp.]